MKKKHTRRLALLGAWVTAVLIILGFSASTGAQIALADTPPEITKVIHAVGGAVTDGSHPANSVINGNTLVDWVDSPIRPLSMVADNKAAEDKLVTDVQPDANGECNLAGLSSGSIVAYNAASRLASKCSTVNLQLLSSPVGPGAVGQLIPAKNPLVEIPQNVLPANVNVVHEGWNRDGIHSCPSITAALECLAGAGVYHYGLFGGPVTVGPDLHYTGQNGEQYITHQGASGVSVVAAAAVKAVNPQFQGWTPAEQAMFDQVFPAGTPGFDQPGALSLGNLPLGGSTPLPAIEDALGPFMKTPVGQVDIPQAKAIPAPMSSGPAPAAELIPDVIDAGVSVTKAAASVGTVAASVQSGNPMGLLQAPQAINNVVQAAEDVGEVINDVAPGLLPTPVEQSAPVAAPPVQAQPDPVAQVQSLVTNVSSVVSQFTGGNPAPAADPAPAPVAPNPVGDLAALGTALFGAH